MIIKSLEEKQKEICFRFGAEFYPCQMNLKVGISRNVQNGEIPVNGLRIKPEEDTTGWYIWAGEEFSDDPNFFVPLHVFHLYEWRPLVLPYLGLPPGWRFLITEDYEDVWYDEKLLYEPV